VLAARLAAHCVVDSGQLPDDVFEELIGSYHRIHVLMRACSCLDGHARR
jgi:hypothetical protein